MFDFESRTQAHSRKNAFWLGRASQIAYLPEEGTAQSLKAIGLNLHKYLDREGTQAFFAGNDDVLILAFRGTNNLIDWITDFNLSLVAGPGGRVHEGFLDALFHVWKDIWQFIRAERGSRPLWITGHSLGGALATLAVAKLRLEKQEPVNGCYTFGQPRVGDQEFARNFDTDFFDRMFRYVNHNDIVPRVPFRILGYADLGDFRYFDQNGKLREDIAWWEIIVDRITGGVEDVRARLEDPADGRLDDHDIVAYIERLEKAQKVRKRAR